MFQAEQDMALAGTYAAKNRISDFIAAGLARATAAGTDLHAIEVVAQNNVNDATDRVRAIDRGCAVSEDFDALDRFHRNDVEILD